MTDLQRSCWHLQQAEVIDPDYCDVHQQFAHVAIQQFAYIEFEERLLQALTCPFTVSGSMSLWQQYWQVVLDPKKQQQQQQGQQQNIDAARQRYESYMVTINAAIEKEKDKEG